ncbi:14 kDa phosphohistidine phosphatase isoform X3 [Numida meleagris]|uniref:14 kDa phosphohistidine phosphatase isoform X3 n=1 Tax=Numida meleagris TaxID=8996 RepID=UPI000B3DA9A9|nr:14 kDa phosphohistidine phosphatase isoform X3 [Numida meleagris]
MAAAAALRRVADVEIDDDGVFKAAAELEPQGFDCECLGGGRISHQRQEKKIHVYGYSVVSGAAVPRKQPPGEPCVRHCGVEVPSCEGFGRANHSVTTQKLKAKYPDYEITWADEGY